MTAPAHVRTAWRRGRFALLEIEGAKMDWYNRIMAAQPDRASILRAVRLGYLEFVQQTSDGIWQTVSATVADVLDAVPPSLTRGRDLLGIRATVLAPRAGYSIIGDAAERIRGAWTKLPGEDVWRLDPYAVDRNVALLTRAAARGKVPWADVRNDLARLAGGEDIDYRRYGVQRSDLTALRTAEYRARRVAATETLGAAREATLGALDAVGIVGATWTLSDDHPRADECDDLAGQLFPLDEWPDTHPFCMCLPGPPYEYAAGAEPAGETSPSDGGEPGPAEGAPLPDWTSPLDNESDWDTNAWGRQLRQYAEDLPGNRTEEELAAALDDAMAQVTQHPDLHVFVRAPGDAIDSILADGRFRPQTEGVESSGGMYNPDIRRRLEEAMFGPTSGDRQPVYGYLDFGDGGELTGSAQYYGEIKFKLRDSAKAQTTFTFGDSLNQNSGAVDGLWGDPEGPIEWDHIGVRPTSFFKPDGRAFGVDSKDPTGVVFFEHGPLVPYEGSTESFLKLRTAYIEAQIHNGVPLDLVSDVWIPEAGFGSFAKLDTDRWAAALSARGIRVHRGAPYGG